MVQYIHYKTLAQWTGFTPETARKWSQSGHLARHFIKAKLHYTEDSINAFLKSIAQGPVVPPTVGDFQGGVRLITLKQAADILGIEPFSLMSKITRKRFGGLRFGGEWRFADAAVYNYKTRRGGYVTREDLQLIFGCSLRVVNRWENEGILEPVQVRGAGQWKHYYRPADVVRTIQHCLPLAAKRYAGQWLFEAVVSTRPPLATTEAMEALGMSRIELLRMADRGELFYLVLESGTQPNRRFSPVGIERALLRQHIWTPQEIGHVLDANPVQVREWTEGALACPLHDHDKFLYREACMVAVVAPLLSPGATARNWLAGRRESHNPPLTATKAAAHWGVTADDVSRLAAAGQIRGLHRPDGVWMVSESWLRLSRAEIRRRLASCP